MVVSEDIKKKDRDRRGILMQEKRARAKFYEDSCHRLPNEFRRQTEDHYDDFYLGE
jgi:hypothetical protein